MPSKQTLWIGGVVIGLIMLFVVVTVALRGGFSRQPEATPTPNNEQTTFILVGTATLEVASQAEILEVAPTSTAELIAVLGADCGSNCMWSALCVSLGRTLPEKDGMTRVVPNSCHPVNPDLVNITSDNPWPGMPCQKQSTTCMWSTQCVELGRVSAIKNGLAPVLVGSCQPVTP